MSFYYCIFNQNKAHCHFHVRGYYRGHNLQGYYVGSWAARCLFTLYLNFCVSVQSEKQEPGREFWSLVVLGKKLLKEKTFWHLGISTVWGGILLLVGFLRGIYVKSVQGFVVPGACTIKMHVKQSEGCKISLMEQRLKLSWEGRTY